MVTIHIPYISIADIIQSITLYSDNAFKIAIEKYLNNIFSHYILSQIEGCDIKIDIAVESWISVQQIKEKGLKISRIIISIKHEMLVENLDFCFDSDIPHGYYDYMGNFLDPIFHQIKIIKQKKAYKYIKIIDCINIPAKYFIIDSSIITSCECQNKYLYPTGKLYRREYIVWYCCICGKEYICSCFKKALENMKNYCGPGQLKMLNNDLKNTTYKDKICHLCRNISSSIVYYQYASHIGMYYIPYINREKYEYNIDYTDAENKVREIIGIPKIGEGWITQTQVYYIVKALFPEYEVLREASPWWLGRQRYDVYIPEKRIAIEYQGLQHYEAIEMFGGEEGLKNAIERDNTKRKKSKENGVNLIEISYNEKVDEESIYKKISKYL